MKKIIFLTLFVLFTFVAYGDNLQWSTTSYSDYEAKLYCENLREEGYSDWRLPTISELKTLQNCHATETTGIKCWNNRVRCVRTIKKESSKTKTTLNWSEKAHNSMNWNDAVDYCKSLNGGFGNWRLPSIDELRTLIQNHPGTKTDGSCKISDKAGKLARSDATDDCNGRYDSNFSKLGDKEEMLWSSSVLSDDPYFAWHVYFYNGAISPISKNEATFTYVRCVQTAPIKTGPSKTKTLSWSNKTPNEINWYDAIKYCENLKEGGYSNWRLPTISELRTLIQNCPSMQSDGPCGVIDECLSPECHKFSNCNRCLNNKIHSKLGDSESIWSSSPVGGDNSVWAVTFGLVSIKPSPMGYKNYVRCVR